MPVTSWNTTFIDGDPYLVIDMAKLRVPLNWRADSKVFLAVAAPDGIDGDALFSHPALVQGDMGPAPTLDEDVDLTVLEYDDATPDSAKWTLIAPGIYKYVATQRKGPKGDTGTPSILGSSDLSGTVIPGSMMVVNADGDGAVWVSQKVGDWYVPAEVLPCPSGNNSFTIASVAVAAQLNDWRPIVEAQTIVTASGGTDVITDLVARINTAGGNEIGRCFGLTATERLTLCPAPPAGSNDGWDRIAAGVPANILVRVERTHGGNTATTSPATTRIRVKADPIPAAGS